MSKPEISIDGVLFTQDELAQQARDMLATDGLEPEGRAFYGFIQRWLDAGDDIEIRTSGSTGPPKSYRVRKSAMTASAKATEAFFKYRAGDNLLLCLSADYIAGKMMIVRALTSGCNLVTVPVSANPLSSLQSQANIEFAAMVPLQIQTLMDLSRKHEAAIAKLGSIKKLLVGGSQVNDRQAQFLANLPCTCYESYGMTETLTHIAVRRITPDPERRTFTALPGVSVAVDARGCLSISVAHLDIRNLATNDLAKVISPGEFEITGRIDNVINTGGVKVSPEQVENKLQQLYPDVRFIIFPMADDKFQNMVVLLIESREEKPSLEDIRRKAAGVLQPYEMPRKIFYADKFSYTSSGKIKRQETLDRAAIS